MKKKIKHLLSTLLALFLYVSYTIVDIVLSQANQIVRLFACIHCNKYYSNSNILDDPKFIGKNNRDELFNKSEKMEDLIMEWNALSFIEKMIHNRALQLQIQSLETELIDLHKLIFKHTEFYGKISFNNYKETNG